MKIGLWYFIKPYKFQTCIGFIFKIIEAFLELMIPLVIARIIDVGIIQGDKDFILSQGLLLIVLSTCGYLSALVCQYYASITSQSVGTKIKTKLYHKINHLSISDIDGLNKGSLVTRITSDIIQIQQAIAMTIRLTSRAPFLIIGSLVLAFLLSPRLTFIFIIGAIVLALFMTFITVYALKQYTILQRFVDTLYTYVKETLEGNRVIRAFSRQQYQKEKFDEVLSKHCKKQIFVGKIQSLSNPMTYLIVNVCIISIIYYGGIQVQIGSLSQGEVIALVNYMTQILLALIVYTNVMTLYNRAGVSYKRVFEVLNMEPSLVSGNEEIVENNEAMITFDHVSFGYNDKNVLHHVSFSIMVGQSVGVIGSTGSGKSTLVKLINRFYDTKSGEVRIYGKDIKQLNLTSLRNMIGYVPQVSTLFTGTIKSNVLMGAKQSSDEEVIASLEHAQAKEMIEQLELGIETKIEQGGKNLSGGQRQRVCIARALIKNASLLILDDSSSALDNVTEKNLKNYLDTLQCTKLIISQRISAIRDLDRIIVMDKGCIESIGSHEQLMQHSLVYQEIFESQNKEDA